MSKESRLIKNTAIIAIGNICTKCVSFFLLPLYTSLLSAEEYGTIDLINIYVSLLIIICTLQLEQGVFRYLIDARGNIHKEKGLITTILITICATSGLFLVISIPILESINYQYKVFLIINVIIGTLNYVMLQIPRGLGDNFIYAVGSFITGAATVILNVVFIAFLHLGVNGMLLASILALLISGFYLVIKLKIWNYIDLKHCKKIYFRSLLKYSIPLIPNTLCWWVVNASDRVIIKTFLGIAANGVYSVAYKFPTTYSTLSNIFQLSWTESASENIKDANRDQYYQTIMNQSMRLYSIINMVIIIIMPFVFEFLVKSEFVDAYYYIPILMMAAFFHSLANLYGSIYTAFKKTKEIAKTTIIAAVLNIVISCLFINYIGLYAAAISSMVAYIVITIMRHVDIQKYVNIVVPKKYILLEIVKYCIVIGVYYSKNIVIQSFVFILGTIYFLIENHSLFKSIVSKFLHRIKEN